MIKYVFDVKEAQNRGRSGRAYRTVGAKNKDVG